MAVSKRTRFEVLRRDNHTCRYCRATDAPLTIDHVTPVALGGTDDPSNLVTACRDCNAGKSSTAPDAETVAQVAEDAIRWAKALRVAAQEAAANRDDEREVLGEFYDMWNDTTGANLPADWEPTILRYLAAGLSMRDLQDAAYIALGRLSPYSSHHFRYFCGICKNKVEAIAARAREIMESEALDDGA